MEEEFEIVKSNFSCTLCPKTLTSRAQLQRHMSTIHRNVEFICDIDGRRFKNKNCLRLHIYKHRKYNNLTCNVCGKVYTTNQSIRKHLRTHFERYKCQYCEKEFLYKQALHIHIDSIHKELENVKCQYCTRLFSNKTNCINHIKLVHRDNVVNTKKYKCTECEAGFELREELRIHSFIHFEGEIHTCTECHQIFKTKRQLKAHMQKHEPKKDLRCDICGVQFQYSSNLLKHIKIGGCKKNKMIQKSEEELERDAEIAKEQFVMITKNFETSIVQVVSILEDGNEKVLEKGSKKVNKPKSRRNEKTTRAKNSRGKGARNRKRNENSSCDDSDQTYDKLRRLQKSRTDPKFNFDEFHHQELMKQKILDESDFFKTQLELLPDDFQETLTNEIATEKSDQEYEVVAEIPADDEDLSNVVAVQEITIEGIPLNNQGYEVITEISPADEDLLDVGAVQEITVEENLLEDQVVEEIPVDTSSIEEIPDAVEEITSEPAENNPLSDENPLELPESQEDIIEEVQSPSEINSDNNAIPSTKYRYKTRSKKFSEPFHCNFCLFTTSKKADLLSHLRSHVSSNRHKCKDCSETFSSKEKLHKHSLKVHKKGVFGSVEYSKKTFECEICKIVLSLHRYKAHMKLHQQPKLTCDHCGSEHRTKGGLDYHITKCHKTDKTAPCSICGKVFSKGNLKKHEEIHKERVYVKCEICDKLMMLCYLKAHVLQMHAGMEKPKNFICTEENCGKAFRYQKPLDLHIQQVHVKFDFGKIYQCPNCDFKATRAKDLRLHSFEHYNGPVFPCEKCDLKFKTKKLKQIHEKCHLNSELRKYPCRICKKTFQTSGGRIKHERKEHPSAE